MHKSIKKLFCNGKVFLLGFLLLWSIVTWIINPPFYKTQNIKIIQIEEIYKKSGFKVKHLRKIHYEYILKNGKTVNDKFLSDDLFLVKTGEYVNYNVPTSYKYGGKLYLFSTASFVIFLLFWSYFIIVFIFKKMVFYLRGKKISEIDASATVFGILTIFLLIWAAFQI